MPTMNCPSCGAVREPPPLIDIGHARQVVRFDHLGPDEYATCPESAEFHARFLAIR